MDGRQSRAQCDIYLDIQVKRDGVYLLERLAVPPLPLRRLDRVAWALSPVGFDAFQRQAPRVQTVTATGSP